jgi:hypothetical protein
MLITDYAIKWITPFRAVLSWEAGSGNGWWAIYVDGRSAGCLYGSGSLSQELNLSERENHCISLIQCDAPPNQDSPESPRRLRPIIRWLGVPYAAAYLIYEVGEDGTEFELWRAKGGESLYSYQYGMDLPLEGLNALRIRVVALGSWGECDTPSLVLGLLVGHPARVASMSVQESSAGLELTLASQ